MHWITGKLNILAATAALAALPFAAGCDDIECGPGTFQEGDVCVVDNGFENDDPRCGIGTHLEGGECIPTLDPAVCDDTTTLPEIQADGTIVCVGTGGGGCGSISCGDPGGGGFVSLCGQILDVETNEPVRTDDASGAPCDPAAPTADGPCSLQVVFFDALGFAANPSGTAPQDADLVEVNDCGHFKGIRIERPFSGQIAIGVENVPGAATDRVLSGIAITADMGELRKDLRAFAFSKTTDAKWTSSAGDPFSGTSFVEKGAYVPVFCSPNCRLDGQLEEIKVTRGGTVIPADDYYFDDTDRTVRSSVSASQDSTGINGAAIMVNSPLGQHSAEGGDIGDCEWESQLATSVPTALFFRESFTHEAGDPDIDCP